MGRTQALDLFGPFVAPLPREEARPSAAGRHAFSGISPRWTSADLCLEAGVATGSARTRRRRRATMTWSVLLHALAVTALVVTPLLLSSGLPEPVRAVHAFIVEPLVVPAPPPPPAPAARAAAARVAPKPEPAGVPFSAPVEVPSEVKPEEWLDLGPAGARGGVEGGVQGGVIGAVVGGAPDAAAEPPPAPPLRVTGVIKEPDKIRHVDPVYPPVAAAARVSGLVVIEALVDERGRVAGTSVVSAEPPLFEEAALEAVRQWLYTPTLLDGMPVRVLLTITVRFEVTDPS